jgi:hypothetical protein
MTRDEAVQEIKDRSDFYSGSSRDATIVARLKEAQDALEMGRTLPWFLLEEDATLSLTADSATASYPTDFIRIKESEGFHYVDSGQTVYLEKVDFETGKLSLSSTTESGSPTRYARRKSGWYFFPPPSAALTLTYSYYKKAESLSTNIENEWLANVPYLLVGRAGYLFSAMREHKAGMAKFKGLWMQWETRLQSMIIQREEANRQMAMGEGL